MEEDATLEVIMEREQAIKKLEADIVAVNDIFKELGTLVHEQGEMIGTVSLKFEICACRIILCVFTCVFAVDKCFSAKILLQTVRWSYLFNLVLKIMISLNLGRGK